MRTRILWKLPLICAPLFLGGCGGDSGTSAKIDNPSSSSVVESSSSSAKSSSSTAKSSSSTVNVVDPSTVVEGTMTDSRDGQTYKTVTIGNQTWMAQNLNYSYTDVKYQYENPEGKIYTSDSTSWCYNNVADSCAKYGRLYTWAAAIDSVALANDADNPQTCGLGKNCDRLTAEALAEKPIQGVCPSGWHLPSLGEWISLRTAIGDEDVAGTALKSTSGWSGWNVNGGGMDAYGFSALPAGSRDYDGSFFHAGYYAFFWSALQADYHSSYAYNMYLPHFTENAELDDDDKYYGRSVRCIKN